jgi:hypothetical protein
MKRAAVNGHPRFLIVDNGFQVADLAIRNPFKLPHYFHIPTVYGRIFPNRGQ